MKTSAPASTSSSVPGCAVAVGVVGDPAADRAPSVSSPAWIAPLRSQATMWPTPCACSSRMMACPAAPTPQTTIADVLDVACPTTRSALVRAARTTIAVPCWSSWKTGMSSSSRSRRSISKQRGAAMSSRLMPP